ncbi:hypothetical protein GQ54DRAFT_22873 [Martensiomyces pterosporus]|nr:hypothetical protein GQ54DRAFT_22873 [Martensiomyces pterosporus]
MHVSLSHPFLLPARARPVRYMALFAFRLSSSVFVFCSTSPRSAKKYTGDFVFCTYTRALGLRFSSSLSSTESTLIFDSGASCDILWHADSRQENKASGNAKV